MKFFIILNYILAAVFATCYIYQAFYIVSIYITKKREYTEARLHKFAVIIAARNESSVISQLIGSIRAQDYPSEYVDICVIADNCTDNTAEIAREKGAIVYERQNKEFIGKGYALRYLFDAMKEDGIYDDYDAFIFFDADNILDKNFIKELNNTFSNGYDIVTSYRASKNFADNWISAGHSIWFMHDCRHLNSARMRLGNSCMIGGTGFLLSRKTLDKLGGWKYFSLAEDLELTVDSVLADEKIGYNEDAVFFDEQPDTFKVSFKQRIRWVKGIIQVIYANLPKLWGKLISEKKFSCYDVIMSMFPSIVLSYIMLIVNALMTVFALISRAPLQDWLLPGLLTMLAQYIVLALLAAVLIFSDSHKVRAEKREKILHIFTFPIYMFSYMVVLIGLAFMYNKVEWTPIAHKKSLYIN